MSIDHGLNNLSPTFEPLGIFEHFSNTNNAEMHNLAVMHIRIAKVYKG